MPDRGRDTGSGCRADGRLVVVDLIAALIFLALVVAVLIAARPYKPDAPSLNWPWGTEE